MSGSRGRHARWRRRKHDITIDLTDAGAGDRLATFAERVRLEIERARRYERLFSLSMFDGIPAGRLDDGRRPQYRATDASAVIDGRLVVLWSEVDGEGAAIAARRLMDTWQLRRSATVTFPVDGLTLTALTGRLTANLHTVALPRASERATPRSTLVDSSPTTTSRPAALAPAAQAETPVSTPAAVEAAELRAVGAADDRG